MPTDEQICDWLEHSGLLVVEKDRSAYWQLYDSHPEDDHRPVDTPSGPMPFSKLYLTWAKVRDIELTRYDRSQEPVRAPESLSEGHGGSREGAGRQRRLEELSDVRKTIRMTQSEYDESLGLLKPGEGWSQMVRRLIREEIERPKRLEQVRQRVMQRRQSQSRRQGETGEP